MSVNTAPAVRNGGRYFLGTRLSPGATTLLGEVESLYRKPVVAQYLSDDESGWGCSRVSQNGTPLVLLNRTFADDEEVIVHELYHLKLRALGAPIFSWDPGAKASFVGDLTYLASQIYDALQHRAMPTSMLILGLNPASKFQAAIRAGIERREWPVQNENSQYAGSKAVPLVRTFVEFGEGKEFRAVRQWYQDAGWRDAIQLADEMIRCLLPETQVFKEHVSQFLNCVGVLGFSLGSPVYRENVTRGGCMLVEAIFKDS